MNRAQKICDEYWEKMNKVPMLPSKSVQCFNEFFDFKIQNDRTMLIKVVSHFQDDASIKLDKNVAVSLYEFIKENYIEDAE